MQLESNRDGFSHLVKVPLAIVPGPSLPAELRSRVEGLFTSPKPGVIIQAVASAEDLASCVGLLHAFIVCFVDEGCLLAPIILAVSQFERSRRSGDFWDLVWVSCPVSVWKMCKFGFDTKPATASITKILISGFSASRPATTFPAVPPVTNERCILL